MVYENYFLLVLVTYFSLLQKHGIYFSDVERESAKTKKDSCLGMSDDINLDIPICSTESVHT